MAITASNSATVYATNSPSKYPWEFYVQFTESKVSDGATNTSTIDIYGYMNGKNINYSGYSNRHMYIYWFDNNEHSKGTKVAEKLNINSTTLNKKVELSGSITVKHKDDGTLSGYAKIFYDGSESSSSWAAPDTTVVTKDTALTKIARYLNISKFEEVAANRTEENIRVTWQTSNTCSNLVLYLNDVKYNTYTPNSTSGNIDVAVSPGSTNKIYIKCTRADSGLTSDSAVLSLTSYQWPYVSTESVGSIVIGNNAKVSLYNPRNLPVTVYMTVPNIATPVYTKSNITTNGEITLLGSEMNTVNMYKSIPNSQTGTATYYCQYSNKTIVTRRTGVYSCNRDDCIPDVSGLNIKYKDNSSTVQGIMQDDQVLVQSHSQLAISFDKATAQNGADIKTYRVSFGGKTKDYTASTNGTYVIPWPESIIQNGTTNLIITAIDTRDYQKESSPIPVIIRPWSKPTVNATAARQNDFEEETSLTVKSLHYSELKNRAGEDKNISAKTIEYKYINNETGVSSASTVISDNSTTSLQLNQDNSFTIIVSIADAFGVSYGTTASVSINRGVPIAMVDGEKLGVGINCFPDGKGLYVDGPGKYTGPLELLGGIRGYSYNAGDASAGYMHLFDIERPTSKTTDMYISFDVMQRNRRGSVDITFQYTTDGTFLVSKCLKRGDINVGYVHKTNASGISNIVSVYIATPAWDYGEITNIKHPGKMQSTTITWVGAFTATKPTNWTQADDSIYPIGSIYMSTKNISPASLFGGTWTRITDKFLLGATDSNAGTSANASSTGGSSKSSTDSHTLTANQSGLRQHAHVFDRPAGVSYVASQKSTNVIRGNTGFSIDHGSQSLTGNYIYRAASTPSTWNQGPWDAAEGHSHGMSHTHSQSLPPYLAVYMWQKTAE